MRVRWLRVVVASVLLAAVGNVGLDRYRVWWAGGDWCIAYDQSGKTQLLYGEACGFGFEPQQRAEGQ